MIQEVDGRLDIPKEVLDATSQAILADPQVINSSFVPCDGDALQIFVEGCQQVVAGMNYELQVTINCTQDFTNMMVITAKVYEPLPSSDESTQVDITSVEEFVDLPADYPMGSVEEMVGASEEAFSGSIGSAITNAVGGAEDTVGSAVGGVVDGAGNVVGDVVSTVGSTVGNVVDGAGNMAGNAVDAVGNVAGNVADTVSNAVGNAVDAIGNFFG